MTTGTVKLREVLEVQNGFAFKTEFFNDAEGLPLIRIRDLGTDKTETLYSGDFRDDFLVMPGDYLIGMDGNFRCRRWAGPQALLNQRVCRLRNFTPEVLPEYVFYGIQPKLNAIEASTSFATVKHISAKQILDIELPLPSLPEQRRIVDLLSRAEGIVRLRREAEKKAAELIPALFLDMFGDPATNPKGWPVEPLSNVCAINPRLAKGQKPAPETQVSFVPMAAVDEHYGAITKLETRSYEAVSKGYTAFQNGDVLFAKITPCMENGKAAIADDLENGLGFGSTEFHVLRSTDGAHKAWLYGLVRLELFRREAKRSFTGTAGQQRVPAEYLKSLDVPIPPMPIQENFHQALTQVRSIQSQQSAALAKAQATFDALLARVFNQ